MAVAGTGRPAPRGSGRRARSDKMWGGSRYYTNRAIEFIDSIKSPNPGIASRKRVSPFGNRGSDHFVGNIRADAVDFRLANDQQAATRLAKRFHWTGKGPFPSFATWRTRHNGKVYQHQLIWTTHGTGPHLHYGVHVV